jgi:hypothetical protein
VLAGLLFLGVGLLLAILVLDVPSSQCDRRSDRCSFDSIGVLQEAAPKAR